MHTCLAFIKINFVFQEMTFHIKNTKKEKISVSFIKHLFTAITIYVVNMEYYSNCLRSIADRRPFDKKEKKKSKFVFLSRADNINKYIYICSVAGNNAASKVKTFTTLLCINGSYTQFIQLNHARYNIKRLALLMFLASSFL